jgi:hypothetical protein
MKYSILMPYYKRTNLLNTLSSFRYFYSDRKDYEVILVVDKKNDVNDLKALEDILLLFSDINIKKVISVLDNKHNPSPLFNLAERNSTGEYLMLTNPECIHSVNILSKLDLEFENSPNSYVLCSTVNIVNYNTTENMSEFKCTVAEWYQHSKFNNRQLHFCGIISRQLFSSFGGFDENYQYGIGWDDNDFITTIKHNNIPVILRDDLVV